MHTEDDNKKYTFIDNEYNYEQENNSDDNIPNNSKKNKYIMLIIILLIIFGVLAFLLIKSYHSNNTDDNMNDNDEIKLVLDIENLELKVGDSKPIKAVISNVPNASIKWFSTDENIANVTEMGIVTGIKEGQTTIIATYIDANNHSYEKRCNVIVAKSDTSIVDTEKPIIEYTLSSKDEWSKGDVSITLNIKDNIGLDSVKYALNCVSNCNYKNVNNNIIKVTDSGTTIVYIVATDKSNNVTTKQITIKIDKKAPTYTLIGDSNVYSNSSVTVCANCKDNESGCLETKQCKTFTSTQNNATLEIEDKVGNKTITSSFNVVIDKEKPTCSLSVDKSGQITASYDDKGGSNISYYGFDSNYSGTNETNKQVSAAGTYAYYIKDKANNTNTCTINVKRGMNNCYCPSGYTVMDEFSTSGCFKYLTDATYSNWNLTNRTYVKTCGTNESLNDFTRIVYTKIDDCAIDESGQCCLKATYTREKICASGQLRDNKCYDFKNKVCSTYYYSN